MRGASNESDPAQDGRKASADEETMELVEKDKD